jgi:hypothetical protein
LSRTICQLSQAAKLTRLRYSTISSAARGEIGCSRQTSSAIHDLRGTFVNWLAMRGLTDDEIARIVGWTAKRIGQIRGRYIDEARVVISLVERLGA